jgi:hypothetical protein
MPCHEWLRCGALWRRQTTGKEDKAGLHPFTAVRVDDPITHPATVAGQLLCAALSMQPHA